MINDERIVGNSVENKELLQSDIVGDIKEAKETAFDNDLMEISIGISR